MQQLSVVIICRNEAAIIGRTLDSLAGLTTDVMVYDSGSSDETVSIAESGGARVIHGQWQGYGLTKKTATGLAKFDWVLSLDADESLSPRLKNEVARLDLSDEKIVYELKFRNYLGDRPLRFGEWGGDSHVRLFNRNFVQWDESPVHENLIIPPGTQVKKLKGFVLHYTARTMRQYEEKLENYAKLNAEKYIRQGRKAGKLRGIFSAPFSFIKNYIFRLGFLDGKAGYQCARMSARYTYLKYAKLRELQGD